MATEDEAHATNSTRFTCCPRCGSRTEIQTSIPLCDDPWHNEPPKGCPTCGAYGSLLAGFGKPNCRDLWHHKRPIICPDCRSNDPKMKFETVVAGENGPLCGNSFHDERPNPKHVCKPSCHNPCMILEDERPNPPSSAVPEEVANNLENQIGSNMPSPPRTSTDILHDMRYAEGAPAPPAEIPASKRISHSTQCAYPATPCTCVAPPAEGLSYRTWLVQKLEDDPALMVTTDEGERAEAYAAALREQEVELRKSLESARRDIARRNATIIEWAKHVKPLREQVRSLTEAHRAIADGPLSQRCPLCHKTTEFSGHPRINNHDRECPCAIAEAALKQAGKERE